MPPFMFPASFGGVSMLLSSMSGRGGRDVVVQSPSRGDAHFLQDRGRRHRELDCELLFVDEPGKAPPDERFREFKQLVDKGGAEILSHPLEGSYRARASNFEYEVDSDTLEIRASCTFLADGEPQAVFRSGAGAAPSAGVEEVGATVAATDEALTAEGLASTVTGDCLSTVTAWSQAENPSSRAIYLEAGSLAERLDAEIKAFELATDLSRAPLYRQYITLRYQITRAAEAVTSEEDRVFDLVVTEAIPALLLCSQVYGAAEAEDRARQVANLNRLRTPGRISPGTSLKMPAVTR